METGIKECRNRDMEVGEIERWRNEWMNSWVDMGDMGIWKDGKMAACEYGGNDKQKGEDINEGEKSAELKRWNGGMQGW